MPGFSSCAGLSMVIFTPKTSFTRSSFVSMFFGVNSGSWAISVTLPSKDLPLIGVGGDLRALPQLHLSHLCLRHIHAQPDRVQLRQLHDGRAGSDQIARLQVAQRHAGGGRGKDARLLADGDGTVQGAFRLIHLGARGSDVFRSRTGQRQVIRFFRGIPLRLRLGDGGVRLLCAPAGARRPVACANCWRATFHLMRGRLNFLRRAPCFASTRRWRAISTALSASVNSCGRAPASASANAGVLAAERGVRRLDFLRAGTGDRRIQLVPSPPSPFSAATSRAVRC